MSRFKKHKVGTRYSIRNEEILLSLLMPPSLRVHKIRQIVNSNGEVELGEWITGGEWIFRHVTLQVDTNRLLAIRQAINSLDALEEDIGIGAIDCDLTLYEPQFRKYVQYWKDGKAKTLCTLTDSFYEDYTIADSLRQEYNIAFSSLLGLIPTFPNEEITNTSGV